MNVRWAYLGSIQTRTGDSTATATATSPLFGFYTSCLSERQYEFRNRPHPHNAQRALESPEPFLLSTMAIAD